MGSCWGGGGGMEQGEGRIFFSEEKEAKRLLSMKINRLHWRILNGQKFFGSFFQERTLLSFLISE
jgi:hypothetical protein